MISKPSTSVEGLRVAQNPRRKTWLSPLRIGGGWRERKQERKTKNARKKGRKDRPWQPTDPGAGLGRLSVWGADRG